MHARKNYITKSNRHGSLEKIYHFFLQLNKSKITRGFLTLLFVSSLTLFVSAQTQSSSSTGDSYTPTSLATGSPLGSASISDIENINLFSGNLNITIPITTVGGRGVAGYTISKKIENRWKIQDAYFPDPGPYGGGPPPPSAWRHHYYPYPGWWWGDGPGLTPGVMKGRRISTFEGNCPWVPGAVIGGGEVLTHFTFINSDGTEFDFFDKRTGGTPAYYNPNSGCNETPNYANRGKVWVTGDGSNIIFVTSTDYIESPGQGGSGNILPTGDMYLPDGTHYRIDQGNVTYIRDSNGNKVSFTYDVNNQLDTVKDSLDRVIYDVETSSTPGVTFYGVGGVSRTTEFGVDSIGNALQTGYTLKGNNELFPELGEDVENQTTPADYDVNTFVKLPNNEQYNFKYNSYGDIARLELPTGGAVEYDWDGIAEPGCGARIRRWITERRVYPNGGTGTNYESKTTYEYGTGIVDGSSYKKTTVTRYDGNTPLSVSKHYFTAEEPGCAYGSQSVNYNLPTGQYGREIQTENYSGDESTLLQRIRYDFEFRILSTVAGNKQVDYRVIRETKTLGDVTPNLVTKREFVYEPNVDLTRQTDVYEYDFGSGQPGTLLRRLHTDYISTNPINNENYLDTDIHLVNLVAQTWISSDVGGTNKVSLTKYEYDNYASDSLHAPLLARDDIVGHMRTGDPNSFNTNYTTRGNLTKITRYKDALNESAGEISIAAQYDIAGNVVKTIDGKGYASTFSFNDNFGFPDGEARTNTAPTELNGKKTYAFETSRTNAKGWITGYDQYDYYTGVMVNNENISGSVSKTIYNDLLDRPTQSVIAIGSLHEKQVTTNYDDVGNKVETLNDLKDLNDNLIRTENFYDGLGRTTETHTYELDGEKIIEEIEYDALGRIFKQSNPYRLSEIDGSNPINWSTTIFDALDRPIENQTADGAIYKTTYAGNRTLITDQAGKKRIGKVNGLGQLIEVWEITAPDSATEPVSFPTDPSITSGYKSTYAYDAKNNLITVNQGLQTRSFTYDSLSWLITSSNPESGTTTYSYDNNNNIITKTDARGVVKTFAYDELDRVTQRSYSNEPPGQMATPTISYTYDESYVPNSLGRLTKISSDHSETRYTKYDLIGRIEESEQRTPVGTETIAQATPRISKYKYNLSGQLIEQTYPSGRVIKNVYDDIGKISLVRSKKNVNAGFHTYAGAFSYGASNDIRSVQLGNGKWETTKLNSRLQVSQISLGNVKDASDIWNVDYEFGELQANGSVDPLMNNGNVGKLTINTSDTNGNPGFVATQLFSFDSLDRLEKAEEKVGTQLKWKQTYEFDRYGNKRFNPLETTTLDTQLPSNITNPVADEGNNQYKSQDGYSYDASGNLTEDANGNRFHYEANGRMNEFFNSSNKTSQPNSLYFYDGNGKRVKKVDGSITTIFIYDAMGKMVAEYTDGAPASSQSVHYITEDDYDNPRVITDKNGKIVQRRDYMPYGEELTAGFGDRTENLGYTSNQVRQGFTGHLKDEETGLNHFGERYYSSTNGRFTSPDPLMASGAAENPQTWNRYAYVANNPISYTDVNGELRRDKNGKVKTQRDWNDLRGTVTSFDKNIKAKGRYVTIYTDRGTAIKAWENAGAKKNKGEKYGQGYKMQYNCHGLTFTQGQLWINNGQVQKILNDEYEEVDTGDGEKPQVGDIVIYYQKGSDSASKEGIVHSATIIAVDGDKITVAGVGGYQTEATISDIDDAWNKPEDGETTYKIFRKKKVKKNQPTPQQRADAARDARKIDPHAVLDTLWRHEQYHLKARQHANYF